MKKPKVAVLMSVYNGEKYLYQAIESILNQTFKDFEFLIINDGSTDKTLNILKKYQKKDKRIKIINNKKNIGLTKSLNKGLKLAKGKYIARMDADDISAIKRLERQVQFLDENPKIVLVGCWYEVINERGRVIQRNQLPVKSREIKKKRMEGNLSAHGALMFRKEYIKRIGFYRERFRFSQDYDLFLRIAEKHKTANIPEYLFQWRSHPDSCSQQEKTAQDKYAVLARRSAKKRTRFNLSKVFKLLNFS